MTPIPRIQKTYQHNFFMNLYFMDYIKDVVIPETKKRLNSAMNLSEYFSVIGCCLIMACYVGNSVRYFFLKDPITPHKGAPIRRHHIIYGRTLEKITQVLSYINLSIIEFNELYFWRHLGWEMVENILDEDTEAEGVDGIRLKSTMGNLGDHEIVKAPKYYGNVLLMRINDGGSSSPN